MSDVRVLVCCSLLFSLACSNADDDRGSEDASLPRQDAALDGEARKEDAQVEIVDAADPLDAADVDGGALSDAGQSACRPGDYQGSFEGMLRTNTMLFPFAIPSAAADAGTSFGFRLGAPDPSDKLPIEVGSARGHSLPLIPPFTWTLTGSLDCSSRQLLGTIQGSWMFDPVSWAAVVGSAKYPDAVPVLGTFSASYDADAGAFAGGTWQVAELDAGAGDASGHAEGTWQAQHAAE